MSDNDIIDLLDINKHSMNDDGYEIMDRTEASMELTAVNPSPSQSCQSKRHKKSLIGDIDAIDKKSQLQYVINHINEYKQQLLQQCDNKTIQLRWSELSHAYKLDYVPCSTVPSAVKPNCKNNLYCIHGLGYRKQCIWNDKYVLPHYYAIGLNNNTTQRNVNTEYVGLVNLGATCYMNVLFQTLFMNKQFRQKLLQFRSDYQPEQSIHDNSTSNNNSTSNTDKSQHPDAIVSALQELFYYLANSKKKTYTPRHICSLLRVQTNVQQDVNEFNSLFMNHIEQRLECSQYSDDSVRSMMKNEFVGKYSNIVQCMSCHVRSERPDEFFDLSLQIKHKQSVNEAIDNMLLIERLNGDNKYMCNTCHSKQDAIRYTKLTQLPPVLNIQLMRFEYDYDSESKKKLTDNIFIPITINFNQYLDLNGIDADSYNNHYAKPKRGKQAKKSINNKAVDKQPNGHTDTSIDLTDEIPLLPLPSHSNIDHIDITNYTSTNNNITRPDIWYDLVAILRHRGTSANHGHYTADVRSDDGQWWCFDDESVKTIPPPAKPQKGSTATISNNVQSGNTVIGDSTALAPIFNAPAAKSTKKRRGKVDLSSKTSCERARQRKARYDADIDTTTSGIQGTKDHQAEALWGEGM